MFTERVEAENERVVLTRQFAAGAAVLVLAAFAETVVIADANSTGRALGVAVITGVLAALLSDWRARIGVAGLAVLMFVGVLADLSDVPPWHFTPLFPLAAALGAGYRRLAERPAVYRSE